VSAESVQVTGIPVDLAFASRPDLRALRAKHGVLGDLPLVLVLSGGLGVGPVEGLVEALWASLRGARLVVVTGRNEPLRARREARARHAKLPTTVLGFTRDMAEWMALATLVVTKPGGLTTSEALARGLPMVVTNPIPGQETRNATMLFEEGAAISGENPLTVGPRVARLLADRARLAALAGAARRLGRPEAAMDVAAALGALTSV
jgi:processive 1,2-diacylglycerol beta-glucosyltransferase